MLCHTSGHPFVSIWKRMPFPPCLCETRLPDARFTLWGTSPRAPRNPVPGRGRLCVTDWRAGSLPCPPLSFCLPGVGIWDGKHFVQDFPRSPSSQCCYWEIRDTTDSFLFHFFKVYVFIFEREREREHVREKGAEREGESPADFTLSAQSPARGSNS